MFMFDEMVFLKFHPTKLDVSVKQGCHVTY